MASTFFADAPRPRGRHLQGALGLFAIFALGCSSSDSDGKGGKGSGSGAGGTDAGPVPEASPPETSTPTSVTPAPEDAPWATLAEWNLFSDAVKQVPNARVIPFEVNSSLFSDYTHKRRFAFVPEGTRIRYQSTDKWEWPVGTVLVKTFSYFDDARDPSQGERLLETRLLVRESTDWMPHTYVWNAEQTTTTRKIAGDEIDWTFIDPSGNQTTVNYLVPNQNECRACHGKGGETNTLGGRTKQLDRNNDYGDGPVNQIDHFATLGLFETAPEPASTRTRLVDPFGPAPLDLRVRSYLDANCSHCHQPGDFPGSLSGFWVDYASTEPSQPSANWGLCKAPQSAGGATCERELDVVPGAPDDSIIMCRLEATESQIRMPPVGRTLQHAEGVALIREWIQGMPGGCGAPPPPDAGTDSGTDAGPRTDAATDAAGD